LTPFTEVAFQTLIGTVKRRLRRVLTPGTLFQTLIGTVKSPKKALGYSPTGEVSNPHRYGQKASPSGSSTALSPAFQTLIGTVKSSGGIQRNRSPGNVSNPHRYGQKGTLPTPSSAAWSCFKPS